MTMIFDVFHSEGTWLSWSDALNSKLICIRFVLFSALMALLLIESEPCEFVFLIFLIASVISDKAILLLYFIVL